MPAELTPIDKHINQTIKILQRVRTSAIPQGARATLNSLAFDARKRAQQNIARKFIERNKFTQRRVIVQKATQRDISHMQSEVGHTERYMAQQEYGASARATGKYHWTALEDARRSGDFSKQVAGRYYRPELSGKIITGSFSRKDGTAKSRSVAEMFMAKRLSKFVLRGSGARQYLLAVKSIRSRAGKVRARTQALYRLGNPRYQVKKRPWLQPAVEAATRPARVARTFAHEAQRIINKALKR